MLFHIQYLMNEVITRFQVTEKSIIFIISSNLSPSFYYESDRFFYSFYFGISVIEIIIIINDCLFFLSILSKIHRDIIMIFKSVNIKPFLIHTRMFL